MAADGTSNLSADEQVALFRRFSAADLAGVVLLADRLELVRVIFHGLAHTFHLDQQYRGGIHGKAGVKRLVERR